MYIKIGKTNLKYSSNVNDYMIFSEIPDSQLSYENPTLVRTKDELDIWFGRDFKDRDYFDELIKSGVTLYLYKPIKENNTYEIDEYIDIDSYYDFPEIFLSLPEQGAEGYSYYLKTVDLIKHYYTFGLSGNRYTWTPITSLEGYTVDPRKFENVTLLPRTGQENTAYYVENIQEFRHWYKFTDNTWQELSSIEELSELTPWRCMFSNQDSLPKFGIYKYQTIQDNKWWMWNNSTWTEIIDRTDLQEFPIYFDTFSDLPLIGDNYRYYVNGVWYIWIGNSWVSEDIFPQNLDNISESLNNRDTLLISKPGDQHTISYSYPEYKSGKLGVFSKSYELDYSDPPTVSQLDVDNINLGYITLAVKLSYSSEELDDGYVIVKSQLPDSSGNFLNYCFYTGDDPSWIPSIYYKYRIEVLTVSQLLSKYVELGYKTIKTGDYEYLIYAQKLFDFSDFYTYTNINLINSPDDTYNILTEFIGDNKEFEFYTKTIGTAFTTSENNQESLVSVKIEEANKYENYRITIGRYDYEEVYEGPLFSEIGQERLDSIINKSSKLVSCNLLGLKNFIRAEQYQGTLVEGYNEFSEFEFEPKIYKIHNYVPPIGEPGIKYKVYPGLWKIWNQEEEKYYEITELSYNFYDFTEVALNYPDLESLHATDNKSNDFKYYVISEDKWYTWESEMWKVIKEELLPGDPYNIRIDRLGYEEYTLYIIAGDFGETYTGNLFDLQNIINNSSSKIFKEFKFKNLCNRLRTGTFYMRGAKDETQTPEMYIKSLGCLFNTQVENIWPDYFLVPDIKKYTTDVGEIKDLEKDVFLTAAKNFDCQFLIQNNEPDYKLVIVSDIDNIPNPTEGILYTNSDGTEYRVYSNGNIKEFTDQNVIEETIQGGDFIFNYTEDISNYLVYFFKPLTVFGYSRPAYYVFLSGIVRNIYSLDETIINYSSPLEGDPYELDPTTLTSLLEKYKSNYMINNNHIFYYKQYFNGPKYYSTIWMRFVLGKIYRELQKDKWKYLSKKAIGLIESSIRETLKTIQSKFSIVGFINLVKFTPKLDKNYLEISVDTYVNDLMDNNITLDITINYNNEIY